MKAPTDNLLLQQAQSGNRESFGILCEKYRSRLYASTYRRIKRSVKLCRGGQIAQNTEDIIHDTFLVTWKSLHKIPPHVEFREWLWGVLRNVIRNRSRLFDRPHPFDPVTLMFVPGVCLTPDNEAARKQAKNELLEAMGRLKPVHREVLMDRYFKFLPSEKIAKKAGISERGVRDRLVTARRLLKRELLLNGITMESL